MNALLHQYVMDYDDSLLVGKPTTYLLFAVVDEKMMPVGRLDNFDGGGAKLWDSLVSKITTPAGLPGCPHVANGQCAHCTIVSGGAVEADYDARAKEFRKAANEFSKARGR